MRLLFVLCVSLSLFAQERFLPRTGDSKICPRIVQEEKLNMQFKGVGGRDGVPTGQDRGLKEGGNEFNLAGDISSKIVKIPDRKQVPGFAYVDSKGTMTTVAQQKGTVLVIGLWSAKCEPSVKLLYEMAALQPKGEKLGFKVVPVDMDLERWSIIQRFLQKNPTLANTQLYLPGVGEQGTSVLSESIPGLPALFLVDRQGGVAYVGYGFEPDRLVENLKTLLREK